VLSKGSSVRMQAHGLAMALDRESRSIAAKVH
jgi:hypothetical protein